MEGNSLTQQETRSVMINNVIMEGRPIKDILEVKGHDKIISDILRIGKGELRLSEKRIKDIHKGIIYEDNQEQQKKIGEWKNENNFLTNYKGERFDFVPFIEVPEKMHELVNWLNVQTDLFKKGDENAMSPVFIAFNFHVTYVSIHPFYDGNGRTARILMNLILISFGYPPVIIKLNDKDAYNQYLADIQGYGGSSTPFFEFLGKQLVKSQKLVLSAIEGEDIDEPDDLDKKLLLLEKELESVDPDDEVKDRFNADVFLKIYSGWLTDLLKKAIPVMQKFNKFFSGTQHHISVGGFSGISFVNQSADDVIGTLHAECIKNKDRINPDCEFRFSLNYGTLIKGGLQTFGCNYGFVIKFDYIKYSIQVDEFSENGSRKYSTLKDRLLHKPLTEKEIDSLVKNLSETVYHHIDINTKKNGLR
jgi:Fic family protein